MGIVAPIGIMNFLNLASQRGVLIKDGRTLDLLNQVDTIVFDKTGTLTKEQPYIEAIHAYAAYNEADVLTFAAAAETKQTHPIARAILHKAEMWQLTLPHIDEAEYKVGYGLSVVMDHQLVQVGSARFMEMTDITIPAATKDTLEFCQEQGHSVVLVAVDNTLVGAIELRPTLRPEAKEVIARLKKRRHIKSIYIISGDHETPTRKLAQDLGIDHYFAQTLPEKKAELIEQLQDEGKFICYIGDGINDSIALKKSQVSVSLRGASTVATDTAQIVLMDESLNQFADLFDLAKDFKSNMRTGFICLLIPTVIGMGGAFFLQFGMLQTLILTTSGLMAGVANSMLPLLKRKEPAPAIEVDHWPVPPQVLSGSEQTTLKSETSMQPEKGGQTDFESFVEDGNHVGLVGSSRLSGGDTGRWQSG
jgi:Cu2+-exporting ATPase